MAERGLLRGASRGSARHSAPGGGARRTADRRHHRQPDPALDPRKRGRAAYDGAKRKKGSKLHLAVDTLGHLLALHVTPANANDRAEVGRIAKAVQAETGESVEIALVDQGYTGEKPAAAAAEHGIALEVVKLPEAKRGFVLLPRRWVVERSLAWATRFRRLVKDYERCAQSLADLHLVAFTCIMLKNVAKLAAGS
jgi:transposase